MKNIEKIKNFILLHAILFLYSLSAVCSKYASGLRFLSIKWCILYALMIFILGVYAILWQQILKKLPLNLAYANKAVTIIWGMLFGILLFDEGKSFTVWKIIGSVIVLVGVILMVTGEKNEKKNVSDITEDNGNE